MTTEHLGGQVADLPSYPAITKNQVFASPAAADGVPNFRPLANTDLSAITLYATAAQGGKADTALQPVVAGSGIHAGGFAKHVLIAGASAGNHTVTGIKVGDELNEVLYFIGTGTAVTDITDLTSEFTISATDTVNNTSHTDTTGNKLLVRWTKLTA